MNLYKEVIGILNEHNKTINDIQYIIMDINSNIYEDNLIEIDLNNFIEIAKNTDYDNDFGGNEIPLSLKIVGIDWWLERHEYDGSEWFEFKTLPKKPQNKQKIENIKVW